MVNGQSKASLGELVAGMAQDVSSLVRNEIELAKAELRESARRGAAGTGLLVVAVGLLLMTWLLLTFAAVYGLAAGTGLALWASFLIVGGIYLLVAAILIGVGIVQFRKVRGPEQAIEAQNQTREIVSRLRPGTTPTPAPTPAPTPTPPTAAAPSAAPAPPTPAATAPATAPASAASTPSAAEPDPNRADH